MWKNLLHVSAERAGSEVGQYDEGSYLVAPQSSEPAVRQTGGVLVRRAGLSEGQAGTDKRTSLEGRPRQASGRWEGDDRIDSPPHHHPPPAQWQIGPLNPYSMKNQSIGGLLTGPGHDCLIRPCGQVWWWVWAVSNSDWVWCKVLRVSVLNTYVTVASRRL